MAGVLFHPRYLWGMVHSGQFSKRAKAEAALPIESMASTRSLLPHPIKARLKSSPDLGGEVVTSISLREKWLGTLHRDM